MEKVNIWDIEGTEFPAGRRTRVILGQNGAMEGSKFCQGYVVVYKGGGIPEHEHETVAIRPTISKLLNSRQS